MKNLSKVLFIVLGVLMLNVAQAQDLPKKAKENITKQVDKMATVMELNETQKAKVFELKQALFIKNKELTKKFEKGSEEFKAEKKKNMKNYQTLLREVCSKEQLLKWKEHKKNK